MRRYGQLRLFVVFLVVAAGYWTRWAADGNPALFPFVALATVSVTVLVAAGVWSARRPVGRGWLWLNLTWDVFFSSVLCYLTGASYSLGQLVFLAAIGAAAWLSGTQAAMVTAALSSAGFLAALAASVPVGGMTREDEIVFYTEGMFRVFGFFLMAMVSGSLYESIRREQRSSALLGARHAEVLERLSAGVLTADADGVVVGVNSAGRALMGDVLGRPLLEVLPGVSDRAGATWEEWRDGGDRWTCTLGDLPEGGAVVVVEDVTEISRMREERRRVDQLVAASRFAAGLAHEIRNPLSSISGALQILEEEHASRMTTLALTEVRRLDRLVDDFLAIARAPALTLGPVDLDALARDVAEGFHADPRWRGRVTVVCEGESTVVPADGDRLRQALWNLLLNGAQAMPNGGGMEIRTGWAALPSGRAAEWTVRDHGIGIPRDDLERVFDPLFTRRAGGTGLGLAVVDQVVRAHGGTISAELPDSGGTRFRITLPEGGADGG